MFHSTFGYDADGVDFTTATTPDGCQGRLVAFETPGSEEGRGMRRIGPRCGSERAAASPSIIMSGTGGLLRGEGFQWAQTVR